MSCRGGEVGGRGGCPGLTDSVKRIRMVFSVGGSRQLPTGKGGRKPTEEESRADLDSNSSLSYINIIERWTSRLGPKSSD